MCIDQTTTFMWTSRQRTSTKDLLITDLTLLSSHLIGSVPITLYMKEKELIVIGSPSMDKVLWLRFVKELSLLWPIMQNLNLGGSTVAGLICTLYSRFALSLESTSEQETESGN